jgi:proliferating cell nuclear antigen
MKLENPAILTRTVEILSELVTEVRIKVNEFGMSISALDPANVALVGFKLPRSAFSQFETSPEILGINLDSLKKILKRAGTGSSLILEKQENMLNILIQDRIKRNFNLSLIEVESEDVDFNSKIANMEFTAKIEINSNDLIDSIEDCAVVSDACSFKILNGKYIIDARGLNSAKSEFSGDEAKIEASENSRSKYSIEYLQKFMKGAKLCDKTIIRFAENHPLRLDFKTEHMELGFVLAPRVETED